MFKKLRQLIDIAKNAMKQKGVGRKIKYMQYAMLAKKNGVISFRIDRIAKEYADSYYDCPNVTTAEKKWFAEKGYGAYKINWYGMTHENCKDFISDFVFYNRKNYANKKFDTWFDNKLTTYYLLAPFKKNMPSHYFYKDGNKLYSLTGQDKADIDNVLLLAKEKELALKSTTGGHGQGFYKLEYSNGSFLFNGKAHSKEQAKELINSLSDYIITDYERPHHLFEDLCGKNTFAVIRLYMINDETDGPQLIASHIRLGSKGAGYATDFKGTIYCGIDLNSGSLFRPIYMENGYEYIYLDKHPDTKNTLDDVQIPNWDSLKKLGADISVFLPMTPYLVMDVIPKEDGFSVLEINSHGKFTTTEPFYPIMKNKYAKKMFKE